RVWNLASAVRKSFGRASEALDAMLAKTIPLEEGIERAAAAFNDSPEQLERNREQLSQLRLFVRELPERVRITNYLSLAETTHIDEVESARRELLAIVEDVHNLFDAESTKRFNLLWREFKERYTEHYVNLHDGTLRDEERQRAIEELTRTAEWREFESLSQLRIVNRRYLEEATRLLGLARSVECELPARQLLDERPTCACRFRLSMAFTLARIPQDLSDIIERGRAAFRRTLLFLNAPLAIALDALARKDGDEEAAGHALRHVRAGDRAGDFHPSGR
ncbi:MAG: DUF6079 family protein, partial [Acidobacteriota bacterium]|nr:DUF6079 family protein [Acidobacteriota bacterium]